MIPEKDTVYVTKTFLPPKNEYLSYIEKIWQSDRLTNQGPILKEFESDVEQLLGLKNFQFVANGTLAIQIALRSLGITSGDIITTPFSYVATTSAVLWEHCQPVYVDINPKTFNLDASKIESSITANTKAILAVHVFGNPCDIEAIDKVAKKYNLPVIYDAAHGFGVKFKGKSLLGCGDISTCSFHSTKPFHTIEGGAVIAKDSKVSENLELIKRFGHNGDEYFCLGTNAKASEFQAAMGLCNLRHIADITKGRQRISKLYDDLLSSNLQKLHLADNTEYNYAYYPVVFASESQLLEKLKKLNNLNIYPRRYFYPSLNKLPYLTQSQACPVSEDIASRIACLPLYSDIPESVVEKISEVVSS